MYRPTSQCIQSTYRSHPPPTHTHGVHIPHPGPSPPHCECTIVPLPLPGLPSHRATVANLQCYNSAHAIAPHTKHTSVQISIRHYENMIQICHRAWFVPTIVACASTGFLWANPGGSRVKRSRLHAVARSCPFPPLVGASTSRLIGSGRINLPFFGGMMIDHPDTGGVPSRFARTEYAA